MPGPVNIAARSPGLRTTSCRLVVTLPTFRRPEHLLLTLGSLARQTIREPFAVVVMENDCEGLQGLHAARTLFESGELSGMVILAEERGNCSAYNAGWEAALETFTDLAFLAVIDDDEIAAPDWLERLVASADALGTDFVAGPQIPVFATPQGERLRRHPVFTPPYERTGKVPILYSSGNVLIARRVLEAMPRPFLDPVFNFLGGGDSDFYARARGAGLTFGWCAEASVHETTPERRTQFSWIHARSLRNGAISSIIEQRRAHGVFGRLRSLAKSLALLVASPFRAVRLGVRTRSAVIALYPVQVALGRFQGAFGGVNEQYRRPEAN